MKDQDQVFEEDRAMEVIRRAIEIDLAGSGVMSESEIRNIAAQLDIKPSSLDRAFREAGSVLVARPPEPPSAVRRWIPVVLLVAGGIALAAMSPESFKDPWMTLPYLVALAGSSFGALNGLHKKR